MAPKMNILELRTMKIEAKKKTVDFAGGGLPKRMQGTKANDMNHYKSRFDTLGLGSGGSSASSKSLQSNAQAVADKAAALGEAMGQQRVPMVADAAKTMERMMDKFVHDQLDKYAVAAAERQNKEFNKSAKGKTGKDKKHKQKEKKKKDKKKKNNVRRRTVRKNETGNPARLLFRPHPRHLPEACSAASSAE